MIVGGTKGPQLVVPPCTYPCADETDAARIAHAQADEVEREVAKARAKVVNQLTYEAGQKLTAAELRKQLRDAFPTHELPTNPQLHYLIGYIGQAHTSHAVDRLVDDARDFNDIIDEYEHRVDPAQFARRPNVNQ